MFGEDLWANQIALITDIRFYDCGAVHLIYRY